MQLMSFAQRQERLSGSLWFFPLVMTVAALLLGFVLGRINEGPSSALSPVLFHGGAEEARRLLVSIATATIGVFAVVVGLTLVALQVASNRYSPRLVRTILRDRKTQLVLSLFIATFAYNAAGLYTVGKTQDDADYPRLAVTVGLVLLFVCIAALVYYVDRVAHTIQLHSILRTVGNGAGRAIAARPAGIGRAAGQSVPTTDWHLPPPSAITVAAPRSGYVQRLSTPALIRAAASQDAVIKLVPGIGGHVVEGGTLAWAWRIDDPSVPLATASLEKVVGRSVTIGAARSNHRDVALAAIEMVDIALLSMHIFDYHTVEQSAAELTVLLSRLARLPLGEEVLTDSVGGVRLIVPGMEFEEYLELACGEIRRKGSAEPVVLRSLVRMLRTVGGLVPAERVAGVMLQLELIRSSAKRSVSEQHDLDLMIRDIDEALLSLQTAPHPMRESTSKTSAGT